MMSNLYSDLNDAILDVLDKYNYRPFEIIEMNMFFDNETEGKCASVEIKFCIDEKDGKEDEQ